MTKIILIKKIFKSNEFNLKTSQGLDAANNKQ